MTQPQSLDDLKAENEQAEAEEAVSPQEVEDTEEVEAVDVETEEPEEEAETPEGEAVETETEAWMTEETAPKTVPLATLQNVRGKLKEKNRDLQGENSDLRGELEKLKAQIPQGQPQPQAASTVMPTLESCEYDETKYQAALNVHYQNQSNAQFTHNQQVASQQAQAQKQLNDIQQKSDEHYKRAQELVTKHGINPEMYGQADRNVRQAIDQILPGQGDATTDRIISILGEGSEKVLYAIGRNDAELDKVKAKLISDPTGLALVAYLGQKNAEFSMPAKKKSQAPKPATKISGKTPNKEASKFERTIKAAQKKGDHQAEFTARMAARRAGVDTRGL